MRQNVKPGVIVVLTSIHYTQGRTPYTYLLCTVHTPPVLSLAVSYVALVLIVRVHFVTLIVRDPVHLNSHAVVVLHGGGP